MPTTTNVGHVPLRKVWSSVHPHRIAIRGSYRVAISVVCLVLVIAATGTPALALPNSTLTGPSLAVDVMADRHAISPDIYGMNWADPALAAELHLSLDRWGGNPTTRYNWQTGLWNTGSDWFYQNLAPSKDANAVIASDRASGTSTMLSVPTMGWVAKPTSPTTHPFDCGFKVSGYGTQQSTDTWDPNCGNGIRPDGSPITGNNPADTSVLAGPGFISSWVSDLVSRYGRAAAGGVRVYGLDNEPVLWSDTHRDVHPAPTTYDELRDKDQAVAAAVKSVDGSALVAGPSDWGWSAYFDTQVPGDKAAHGNVDLAPWFLQQMKAYADAHGGQRVLDIFDEHYYPQGNGVALGPAGAAATQALRLRSTRSLWDPKYIDESWIGQCCNGTVMLIPRMRSWVAGNYPGTKVGLGEYNFGGLESMNGALAEADVLGILAREQVDTALLWAPPSSGQPGAFAFRMYRNFDGHGATFGQTWVRSTSSDQSKLAVYGAQRSADGSLTLMVVNKSGSPLKSTLKVSNFTSSSSAQVFQYSGSSLGAIKHLAAVPLVGGASTASYPANSITLLVVPR